MLSRFGEAFTVMMVYEYRGSPPPGGVQQSNTPAIVSSLHPVHSAGASVALPTSKQLGFHVAVLTNTLSTTSS